MSSKLLEKVNDEQRAAIVHTGSPLIIIAGAGTGKTTVIAHRIAWLIEQKLAKPDEILALTFTDKAASEMESRVMNLVTDSFADMWIQTFHSFCKRILQNYGMDIGLANHFDVADEKNAWMLMYENFERFDFNYYRTRGNPYYHIHALLKHFSRAKDQGITPEAYSAYAEDLQLNSDNPEYTDERARLNEIASVYTLYNQLLLEHGFLDFGDLLMYTRRLLMERPHILKRLKTHFKYVVVDEFQDTNWIQYELMRLLVGDGNGLSVVADDDQSIYKFRGASLSNVHQCTRDFQNVHRIALIKNYRSGQEILDSAYHFITHNNPYRLEAQQGAGFSKKLISMTDEKSTVVCNSFSFVADENAYMSDTILALQKNGALRDCAVLVRTNAQAASISAMLEHKGIQTAYHGKKGLFAHPVIIDCISWFKLLTNCHDDSACYRILRNEYEPMPSKDVMIILNLARKKQRSYYDTMLSIGRDMVSEEALIFRERFLNRYAEHLKEISTTSVSARVYAYFSDFNIFKSCAHDATDDAKAFLAERTISVIQAWFDEIVRYEETHTENSIHDFLRYLGLLISSGYEGSLTVADAQSSDAVTVATVHSAKGLEFEHVFIPQLVHLKFPSIKRKDAIELPDALVSEEKPEGDVHLAEERRLMYVAMTRAKRGLYLSYAYDYEGKQLKKPSLFIDEIGAKSIHHDGDKKTMVIHPSVVEKDSGKIVHPTTFSYTSLTSFQTCPLQYKFSEMIHIPVEGNAATSFGKTMHTTLEQFYNMMIQMHASVEVGLFSDVSVGKLRIIVPPLAELLQIYEHCFIEDWYDSQSQKNEYRQRGREILKRYYKDHEGKWIIPRAVEQKVQFKLRDGTIKGVIDRIDEIDGSLRIIDYKTGKPKTRETLTKKDVLQLAIYQRGVRELWQREADELILYYLEDGTSVIFKRDDRILINAEEHILDTIESIATSDFSATPSTFNCGMCAYKDICEFRAS